MTTRVEFTYIIADTIAVDVEADVDYPDVDYHSITVNGEGIEEADLAVYNIRTKIFTPLPDLLYQKAIEEYHNAFDDGYEDD